MACAKCEELERKLMEMEDRAWEAETCLANCRTNSIHQIEGLTMRVSILKKQLRQAMWVADRWHKVAIRLAQKPKGEIK